MRTAIESGVDPTFLLPNLKRLDRWLCWRADEDDGQIEKTPVNVNETTGTTYRVSYRDPDSWYTYRQATRLAFEYDEIEGISIVVTDAKDDFVVFDLDGCRDPATGRIDPDVREYLQEAETYAEISPSGTGLHLIFRGSIPKQGWPATDDVFDGEIYRKYIITVTENHVTGTPYRAKANQGLLDRIFTENDIWWRERFYEDPDTADAEEYQGTPQV